MSAARVLIIGGGAMGVSLLYHLAKAGWSDCVLVEKNDLTHGSTWHAAGLCTHFAHNPTIQELRAASVRLYRDILPQETGESCGFHSTGALRVTRNPDRMDEFRHVAGLSQFTGYNLEIVTPQLIAELHPLARIDGLIGGIYEPQDGHVDPTLATNAMAQVAVKLGATILRRTPVTAIRRVAGLWVVQTPKQELQAQHIVNAAGTWGFEVGRMMGVNVPSVPVLHQYLVTDTVPEIAARQAQGLAELPIIRDPEESWYVRQERDGFILGPYEKNAQVWSVDGVPPEFGAELMPPDLERVEPIIEAAMARVPALGNGGIKTVINGPITFTPDANPLIGPAHGVENAWLLTGSSMGVMEGGGAGKFLAHWMVHGGPPMDALAVDSRRFGAWAGRDYRVVKAIECFGLQFGVHYPFEERHAGRGIRRSPLHDAMLAQGAVMGFAHGWERPNWFSTKPDDHAIDSFRRTNWFPCVAREVEAASQGNQLVRRKLSMA
jgi:dimethylglycine dehydrogenase